ncbi:MAG TPA: hypothetical protein PLB25_13690 [Rhodoferax sp.]|nr:hypothetical protein [Rhodoferax sp.]
MHLLVRFLFVLCALSGLAATPAWACESMTRTVSAASSNHPHDAFAATAAPVAAPANALPDMCAAAPNCDRCASCVSCVGLVPVIVDTWFVPGTSNLPQWTPQPLARLGAAPELKPPRA